jgi:hypothetical protein
MLLAAGLPATEAFPKRNNGLGHVLLQTHTHIVQPSNTYLALAKPQSISQFLKPASSFDIFAFTNIYHTILYCDGAYSTCPATNRMHKHFHCHLCRFHNFRHARLHKRTPDILHNSYEREVSRSQYTPFRTNSDFSSSAYLQLPITDSCSQGTHCSTMEAAN